VRGMGQAVHGRVLVLGGMARKLLLLHTKHQQYIRFRGRRDM